MNTPTVQIRRSIALVSLAAAVLIGGVLAWSMASGGHPVLGASRDVTLKIANSNTPAPAVNLTEGFSGIVEPLLPAVVNISSSKQVTSRRFDLPNDPFFRQFFGDQFGQQPRTQHETSLGSGVIVSPDGYILTNNHVVDDATDITVTLKDKREMKATVVGKDPRTDIAVLKIPATGLATVTLGDSSKIKVGDIVLAVGDPFGVGESVTMGIISGLNRRDVHVEGANGYEDFLQTDAAINPGNSGGALVNTRGELIGINTAIATNEGEEGNIGIGFAVPIDTARNIMEQILKTGKVSRGYLGVAVEAIDDNLQKAFNLPSKQGALISDVTADGPGAKAGLQRGDVITAIDGQPVSDYLDLRLRTSQTSPGTTIKVEFLRNGEKHTVSVTLGEFPEDKTQASNAAPQPSNNGETSTQGMQVEDLTPQIAQRLNLSANTHGVVIDSVDPDSPAGEAQLQQGDVIQEVNHKPVSNVQEFRAAVGDAGNAPLLLLVNQGGLTRYVVLSSQQQ